MGYFEDWKKAEDWQKALAEVRASFLEEELKTQLKKAETEASNNNWERASNILKDLAIKCGKLKDPHFSEVRSFEVDKLYATETEEGKLRITFPKDFR